MKYSALCNSLLLALTVFDSVLAFSAPKFGKRCIKTPSSSSSSTPIMKTAPKKKKPQINSISINDILSIGFIGSAILFPSNALADEIGRETEAPTLFTGETVLICTKRGPLGACLETTTRTAENDNDKATKYFRDPADSLKEKYRASQLQAIDDGETSKVVLASDGNELIERLRQQSLDNKEKNDKIIRAKTLQNDMGASFGPLDSQVAILNSDGESFTLLRGAQAMRLKKMGYIKDKRFVTQPTQQVINDALEADESGPGAFLGGIVKGVLGNGED